MLYPFFLSLTVVVTIIITILILNSKISTKFECIKKRDSSDIIITFCLFSGVFKQKFEIPADNVKDILEVIFELLLGEKGILNYKKEDDLKSNKKTDKYSDGNNKIIKNLKPYLLKTQKYLVDKNKIYAKLNLKVLYGTNDAFLTGILGGVIFGSIGIIDSLFSDYFCLEEKSITVEPNFTESIFELEALCILNVRLVNIIKAGLFYLSIFISKKFKNKVGR